MGIQGLLPLLKSIHKPVNLKKFEGKTIGVDAYGWLHRGTVACAMELAMGKPTRKFVDFAMHRVRMLQHFGVIPFLIFDGDYLPSKASTEVDRARRREESKRSGLELLNAGKTSQAYLELQKAVDVTPEMARQLIDELKKTNVQYIVAPYEADAQMVYLERKGVLDGILSEDSDLLVFGAKCLLTKLDQYGNCIEINKADFCACKEITLSGWSDVEFRRMAILSGCDYLASISNMGLKTAYRMVRKHKTIEKVIRMLQFDGKFRVPQGYLESFYQAELTFLHQRVYCPEAKRLVLHTQPEQPLDEDKMLFIGHHVDPVVAQGVARGDLHPMTKVPIVTENNTTATPTRSIPPRMRNPGLTTSDDMKKGVSIERFFRPKRVPLAELDVNCFTPSPSQQQALQRNPGPWDASQARPYISRIATEPIAPRSAPNFALAQRQHARSLTISEPRPPKRARLCEDDISESRHKQDTSGSRSRFFDAPAAEPSPIVSKMSRGRRSKREDITIFSDESIEQAMLGLPDADGFSSQQVGKMPIFDDDSVKVAEVVESKAPLASLDVRELSNSQDNDPGLTQSTSSTTSFEQPASPSEVTPLHAVNGGKLSRFSFNNDVLTPKPTASFQGVPTPDSKINLKSRIPLAINSSAGPPKARGFATKTASTPLQRLGLSATNRQNLPLTPLLTPLSQSSIKRPSMLSKAPVPFPEVKSKRKIDPANIPLPAPDDRENVALEKGSEDLIIHDSDDEALSPAVEPPPVDLRRFLYAN